MCKLSINCDGRSVVKVDGADHTNIEAYKGGISSALKRAASAWGIGRYLYKLPRTEARFLEEKTPGCHFTKIDEKWFYWEPPKLPKEFLPNEKNVWDKYNEEQEQVQGVK